MNRQKQPSKPFGRKDVCASEAIFLGFGHRAPVTAAEAIFLGFGHRGRGS